MRLVPKLYHFKLIQLNVLFQQFPQILFENDSFIQFQTKKILLWDGFTTTNTFMLNFPKRLERAGDSTLKPKILSVNRFKSHSLLLFFVCLYSS